AVEGEAVLDPLLVALADEVQISERAADVLQAGDREAIGAHDLSVEPSVEGQALAAALPVQASFPVGHRLRALEPVLAEIDQEVELALHIQLALHLVDPEQETPALGLQAEIRVHRAFRDGGECAEFHQAVILHDVRDFSLAECGVDCHPVSAPVLTLWNIARNGLATLTSWGSRCQEKSIGRSLKRPEQFSLPPSPRCGGTSAPPGTCCSAA